MSQEKRLAPTFSFGKEVEDITRTFLGKIAVIRGGNSGIGLATAQRFVQEGAFVFITGRRQNELNKAVEQIGKNVTDVQGDISNLADLDRLYDTVKQEKGRIDILFANAGVIEGSITEAHFDKILNINAFYRTKGTSVVSRWLRVALLFIDRGAQHRNSTIIKKHLEKS